MRFNPKILYTGLVLLAVFIAIQLFMSARQPNLLPSIAEPPRGAPFTLQSQQGPVSLSDFEGKLALIYFGYTWCPDICPASLMYMASAIKNLTPEQQTRLQPLFISVDPERDTPERLQSYVTFFDAGMIGLTGEPEYLSELARAYGVFYRKIEMDSAMGYAMDHSADFYLVNHKGELLAQLPHNLNIDQLTERLQQLLDDQASIRH